ncbi:MAG: IPTL-CTERM sorting domain-containing protein [Phycisphaerales bacterium]|nr:MAG: IPTL-CTERM sorting domain-containing protein [Phycisphaerales bacterium]
MNKLAKCILVMIAVTVVLTATAEAAKWRFRPTGRGYSSPTHPEWGVYEGNGWLTVWPTINCNRQEPPLLRRQYIHWDDELEGTIPRGKGYNDYTAYFEWDYPCKNKAWYKLYVCKDGELKPVPLAEWIDGNLPPREFITLPSVGDPSGTIPEVHVAVNLRLWRENPRPTQDSYDIQNGVCPDLPGYRFGITEFKFLPDEVCHPFVTDNPLTGTLYRHADVAVYVPEGPTVSQWGLILMALVLLTAGAIVIARRRRPAEA